MFLQPYVNDKKGFKIQCYAWNLRCYHWQKCIISGYLDDFLSVNDNIYNHKCIINLKNATVKIGAREIKPANKIVGRYDKYDMPKSFYCRYEFKVNEYNYTIYPSKHEIEVKLTKLSKNTMNKVMNYL